MSTTTDKRLLDKAYRRGVLSAADRAEKVGDLPDLADNVTTPPDDEVEALKQTLVTEQVARAERIERFLSEPREPEPPPVPLIPIDAEG